MGNLSIEWGIILKMNPKEMHRMWILILDYSIPEYYLILGYLEHRHKFSTLNKGEISWTDEQVPASQDLRSMESIMLNAIDCLYFLARFGRDVSKVELEPCLYLIIFFWLLIIVLMDFHLRGTLFLTLNKYTIQFERYIEFRIVCGCA
jgi:hypothetical protein